jgi:hypothetical protein
MGQKTSLRKDEATLIRDFERVEARLGGRWRLDAANVLRHQLPHQAVVVEVTAEVVPDRQSVPLGIT